MERGGYVYIMTNKYNTVLYTGVTSDIAARIWEHKNNEYPGSFSSRYKTYKLVYHKFFEFIVEAIAREKQIKGGSRKKKIDLINSMNPKWNDLYNKIKDDC